MDVDWDREKKMVQRWLEERLKGLQGAVVINKH